MAAGYRRFSEELLDLLKRPFQVRGERCKVSGSQVSGKELKSETSPLPSSSHLTPLTSHLTPEAFWALRNVSFDVQPGEVLGIIGRNGAGKSTLLKILSRITEPTEGRVTLNGRVASLLEVGTGFHPELTGRENIYLNGAILGMSRAEIRRKFDEIVAFAEVEKFLDTPVKHYSSGMYVRLAFAVAAHLEPEILIVDEVLAVGDAEFQKKCLGKMGDVAKEGPDGAVCQPQHGGDPVPMPPSHDFARRASGDRWQLYGGSEMLHAGVPRQRRVEAHGHRRTPRLATTWSGSSASRSGPLVRTSETSSRCRHRFNWKLSTGRSCKAASCI